VLMGKKAKEESESSDSSDSEPVYTHMQGNKKSLFDESGDEGDQDINSRFNKQQLEGVGGHMLLQMQKAYKGDNRFKLDDRFTGDVNLSKNKLSENVRGGMSQMEKNHMMQKTKEDIEEVFNKKLKSTKSSIKNKDEEDEVDLEKEKDNAFNVLSQIVPAAEVFFRPSGAGDKRKKNITIKRFDPKKMKS